MNGADRNGDEAARRERAADERVSDALERGDAGAAWHAENPENPENPGNDAGNPVGAEPAGGGPGGGRARGAVPEAGTGGTRGRRVTNVSERGVSDAPGTAGVPEETGPRDAVVSPELDTGGGIGTGSLDPPAGENHP
ncbi:hypothetical protein [Bailinhaonella thermotolerans]|uniref:Uncharacterized protein n=1 Tax=Bailinhaonella thermotolerans TaxID=1070861 RepID=A0A3A4A9E4_9ACTN|nr:hypothetical protein [Bailinhaonella thermotolerans]RJL24751.1 hypothetical protein D5H75_28600 [Bailinhaonella thermotolerans]